MLNRVHTADVLDFAAQLPPQSVQTIVTSPPYFGLRSYLAADHPDKAQEIGAEPTPAAFVATLVAVFRALWPALKDDGSLWLNLGDSYATRPGQGEHRNGRGANSNIGSGLDGACKYRALDGGGTNATEGIKPKDLIGIPWRVALALQADGWYLRSDIVWHKPNPMPESVTDRPTRSHEYIFLLTKRERYFYDHEAIKDPQSEGTFARFGNGGAPRKTNSKAIAANAGEVLANASFKNATPDAILPNGRNKRDVWTVPSAQFPGSHFATFSPELIRPCILAGTSAHGECAACGKAWVRVVEREFTPMNDRSAAKLDKASGPKGLDASDGWAGTPRGYTNSTTLGWQPQCACNAPTVAQVVLDPFGGSGTVAQVAVQERRQWVTCDLDARSVGWTAARLAGAQTRLGIEVA